MARYAVIYDACVLYPAPLRDFLIQLATADLFRAQWTEKIHDEWISKLIAQCPSLDRSKLERTKELMNNAVPDSVVTGYEHLIDSIHLKDVDDRHVVAAALHAKADAIVTFNLKDFLPGDLKPLNLEAIHPDDFLTYQFDLSDAAVIQAASAVCRRLQHPKKSGKDYLDKLLAQRLPKTAAALRPYESIICPPHAGIK